MNRKKWYYRTIMALPILLCISCEVTVEKQKPDVALQELVTAVLTDFDLTDVLTSVVKRNEPAKIFVSLKNFPNSGVEGVDNLRVMSLGRIIGFVVFENSEADFYEIKVTGQKKFQFKSTKVSDLSIPF